LKTIGFYCQASPLLGCNTWSLRWAEAFLINKLLVIESHQVDVKFLTKQLLLMANIVQMAPILGQSREWRTLQKAVPEKSNYIRRIIDDDPKERRRDKANKALVQLQQVLN